MPRLPAALVAAAGGLGGNMLLLAGADSIRLPTAHGGLLRLLLNIGGWCAARINQAQLWADVIVPGVSRKELQAGFHIVVGMLMAILYAYVLEPRLRFRPLISSIIYASVAWLVNGLIVLPLIGEGFAGSQHLDATGILAFAVAHTVYFVLLGTIYERLKPVVRGDHVRPPMQW